METQGKFILMNVDEFQQFMTGTTVNRQITHVQNHHTWSPAYRNFNGANHFEKLRGMESSHIQRGFTEIGQHITTFPDGTVALCRSLEKNPACIYLANSGGICIENLGNFDLGKDSMTANQRDAIIRVNAILCFKFALTPSVQTIVYHHWFRMSNGFRDGGKADNDHKTCPGTAFFGGNTEADFSSNLLPLIRTEIARLTSVPNQPVPGVTIGVVHTPILNVRTGPGKTFPVIGKIKEHETVSILESNGEWDRIGQGRWVHSDYIAVK
ncbi:MAG TPA: N-acetylmuramoyl-L-alanine amidase [Ferruginibacter sp.]|nr:N-acetylmuramoyl-L-alanine amidase [Ferruginibacter sp.]